MSFRNHFDMISLNEPVTHKAKFWQSYVRALKGTEDMRADDGKLRLRPRAVSEFPDFLSGRGIFDDKYASDPNARIFTPGYRYMPISRETYGYSPRPIYGSADRPRYVPRPSSVPPEGFLRDSSPFIRDPSPFARDSSPFVRDSSPVTYPPSLYNRPWRASTPPPTPSYAYSPYIPIYANRGGYNYRPYRDLINPSPYMPMSSITRDPWWYNTYGLRPYSYYPRYPSSLRTSYLSPVKNSWTPSVVN